MASYITIDGGTTNTRISLVRDMRVIDTVKFPVGAKAGIGNNELLCQSVKDGISDILSKNGLCEKDIEKILASGMITSEFGLYKLDHTHLPAGISELHSTMKEVILENISSIPFVFIRGVKSASDNLAECDMIRGEETELMGIAEDTDCVYVLPGSHSKIISIDREGRITSFCTALTGEMFWALSQDTILKGALDLSVSETDTEYLLKGYDYCKKHGINEALFKTRVLKAMFEPSQTQVNSYFLGTVLADEIKIITDLAPKKVIIGGRRQFKDALYDILKNRTDISAEKLTESQVDTSVCLGAVKIYEYNK